MSVTVNLPSPANDSHALYEEFSDPNHPALRDPDVQTMLRAKAGDEEAFAELVLTYQTRVVHVLTPVLGNAEMAEDVAQEVFFRIYQARRNYVPTARFVTWLFRIAHNLAFNRRRDESRRREFTPGGDESWYGVRPFAGSLADKSGMMPTRQFDRSEMKAVVAAAIATLNEHQRMAVMLSKFEGLSYSEIGRALDMKAAAVKSLLSRARENLRTVLEPYVTAGELAEIIAGR
jgi:RNA polymerase sigma-70 factor, ECF subfamily